MNITWKSLDAIRPPHRTSLLPLTYPASVGPLTTSRRPHTIGRYVGKAQAPTHARLYAALLIPIRPPSLPRGWASDFNPSPLSPPLSCAPLLPPPAPRSWARVPVGGWSGRAPHASPPPPAAAAAGVPQQGGKLRRLHHRQPRIPRTRTPRTSSAARAADHNLAAHPPNNRATTQPWPTLVSWRRGRACV